MSGLLSLGLIDTTLSRTLVFRSLHDAHVLEYMLNSIFGLRPLLGDPYGYRDCVIWCIEEFIEDFRNHLVQGTPLNYQW